MYTCRIHQIFDLLHVHVPLTENTNPTQSNTKHSTWRQTENVNHIPSDAKIWYSYSNHWNFKHTHVYIHVRTYRSTVRNALVLWQLVSSSCGSIVAHSPPLASSPDPVLQSSASDPALGCLPPNTSQTLQPGTELPPATATTTHNMRGVNIVIPLSQSLSFFFLSPFFSTSLSRPPFLLSLTLSSAAGVYIDENATLSSFLAHNLNQCITDAVKG